jgi:translation elongation factor EF-4
LEVGVISPEPTKATFLGVGEVGYLITGVKEVRQSRVGDTVTSLSRPASQDLGGYRPPKPMVFAGIYPIDGADYPELREALDKLQLNDAALITSLRRPVRSASDSGSVSLACCTWRSCGSAWNANLILTSSLPLPTWSIA